MVARGTVGERNRRLKQPFLTVSVRRVPGKAARTRLQFKRGSSVSDLMKSRSETIDSVLVVDRKSGMIVPHDALLSEGDELDLLPVISGG